jgi:puromycin-sensitive aminopeptidase
MIAIPDFDAGAMENWGAITYRENAILVDPKHSSASNTQWVALVVAHELAHQWFGNLVTMEWWTHLWLNEGFASYIEYLAVNKLFPKWDIWTQFSTNDLGVALKLDGLLHTHPIEIPVNHPNEIGEIFDAVSYSKGASIIRMLADYLGEKNFRDGLRYYLKKHSYKNTETIHLWQAFEKVSGKKVSKMMHNWTSKPGYPVVKAKMVKGKINFSQSRFFASPLSAKKVKDTTKWDIPITFKKNKVNFGETGFFRTAYSKELLEKLRTPIQTKKLSPRDRLGVIRDLFALSEAGIVPTTDALEFITAYEHEDNYTVWLEIAMGLAQIEQLIAKTQYKEKINKLIIDLFSPIFSKLGWEKKKGEPYTDVFLRSLVISRLGRSGDKKVITEAKNKFSLIKTGKHVDPDIRSALYTIIASTGGIKEYKDFIKLYQKETLHEEKNRIGGILGDFRDPKILKLACEFSISKDVRIQDSVGILSMVGMSPIGRDIWLHFIQTNWKKLISTYGGGGFTLARLVKALSGSAEPKHFKFFKKFFQTHEAPGAKRAISQVLERLESNIAWLKRDGKIIEKFLDSK